MKRTALVTGAARGIGRAISEKLSHEGYAVITPTRSEMDLSDLSSVRRYCETLAQGETKEIQVLINNAGENVVQPLGDIDYETWARIQNINLNSAFLLTQFFGRKMVQAGFGRILNVASLFSFLTREGRASYSASKSALTGLTRTAAAEWSKNGVLVNALSPGFVDTELTRKNNSPERIQEIARSIPAGRLCKPEEIAEAAYFLVSEANTYITGQNIVVDGGYSIL